MEIPYIPHRSPLASLLSLLVFCLLFLPACKSNRQAQSAESLVSQVPVGPAFNADSAYAYCQAQCDFGPRTMNSEAHERCGQWIGSKFQQLGCKVSYQRMTVNGYDGTPLKAQNIIAQFRPELTSRILLCAHWDSRPWADNDPDSANWHKPVMAANDGASGVAVMLEIARLLQQADTLKVGVDFICFDAEDWGTPQWAESQGNDADTWALGAQYWAQAYAHAAAGQDTSIVAPEYRYGILLDMVGGQGARFYQEGVSRSNAPAIVDKVWAAAHVVGYGSLFPKGQGGYITDDHVPINQMAKVPCIDIIPHYPDCQQSSFGPTWHTVSDDMQHIDRNTLQAVGQTILQVLFSEQ